MADIRQAFVLEVKGDKAVLSLADNVEAAGKKIKKAQDTTGGLTGSFVKMAAAAVSARAAFQFIESSLKAQASQQASINKLNLALANQGRLTPTVSKSLQEYAAAVQATTTFSDDAVLSAQAMLASFGLNEAQIKSATKAALDYSAATGTDLESSIQLLGKAFVGNTTQLGKLGFQFNDSMTRAQKFDSAVAQMEGRFGGSAVAATTTFTGAMQQLGNAYDEVKESVGKFLGELLGGEKPFALVLGWTQSLAKFFGQDLIIAMGEARARFPEMLAGFMEDLAQWGRKVAELPGAGILQKAFGVGVFGPDLKAMAQEADDFAESLRAGADEFRRESEAAAAGAGHIQEYSNGVGGAIPHVEKLTDAQKKLNAALREFSGLGLFKEQINIQDVMRDRLRAREDTFARDLLSGPSMFLGKQRDLGEIFKQQPGVYKASGKSTGELFAAGFQDAMRSLPNVILGAIQGGGDVARAIGATMGGSIGEQLGKKLGEKIGGTLGKTLGSAVPVIGALVGDLAGKLLGKLGGLFGGGEHGKVNDLRDQFVAAAGGITELDKRAQAAGLTVDRLLAAKKVHEFEAAVRQLNDAFTLQDEAQRKLAEAVERYGFSIEQLGPKFQQQKLDEMAGQLIQDYKLLTASGIDQAVVIQQMGPAFQEYVNTALAAGAALPESMRPMIELMIAQGLLLDANGVAFTSVEQAGLSFTQTMTEQFQTLIEKIEQLVNAMLGIPNVERTVTVTTGTPPESPFPLEAARGFGPMVVPNMGRGLGPLIQTHAGELVGVLPASMVRAHHPLATRTPFFFGADHGFGGPRQRLGGGGSGGTSSIGILGETEGSTTDGAVSGGTTATSGQLAAVVEELGGAIATIQKTVQQLAERPAVVSTLAPTIQIQGDPTQTIQAREDMVRITTKGIIRALQALEPELVDAVRHATKGGS